MNCTVCGGSLIIGTDTHRGCREQARHERKASEDRISKEEELEVRLTITELKLDLLIDQLNRIQKLLEGIDQKLPDRKPGVIGYSNPDVKWTWKAYLREYGLEQ